MDTSKIIKSSLDSLSMAQLKFLANKLNLKVKNKVVEGWLSDSRVPAGKKDYIKALSKIATDSDIELAKTSVIDKPVVKKKKRKQSSSWW